MLKKRELTDVQTRTLARLRRCTRWAEEERRGGFIHLLGVAPNGLDTVREQLEERTLQELLALGEVDCDTSIRLQSDVPGWNTDIREVHPRYWRAL